MKRIIEATKLNEEKIVIESTAGFQRSAFNNVYQKAELMLENIILQNTNEYCMDSKEQVIHEPIMNLVAFDGRRGTGKTSVMLSIADALRKYPEKSFLANIKNNKSVSFTVLDYIDASLMEENEDVLEIVLANMFSKLRECDSAQSGDMDFEYQELLSLFDEVYGNLLSLHSGDKSKEMSPIRVLTKLSNSQTLEKRIKELVDMYLKYMARVNNQCRSSQSHFLVISIDDLDMRLTDNKHLSPYHLLETLHRYLMIPNVIILLTYNYKDLWLSCLNHFVEHIHKIKSAIMPVSEKYIMEMATEYLNKVIPIYARIHMPSLRNQDYIQHDILLVRLNRNEADQVMKEFIPYLWKSDDVTPITITVKKFVMLLKSNIAGLYYDVCGNKRHFTEPGNLRELTQIFTLCKQLNQIELPDEDKESAIYKEIMDDLYYRFAEEQLGLGEQEKLTSFLDVPIERRSRDIVGDIKMELKNAGKNEISRITNAKLSYSYGELLYYLYNASSMNIYSKPLICCILDSYTIMLTKTYRRLCRAMDEKNAPDYKKYKDCLLDVIGSSVASSWSNVYMPPIRLKEDNNNEGVSNSQGENPNANYGIERSTECVYVGAIRFAGYKLIKWEYDLSDVMTLEAAKVRLQMLEILCMFFTDVYHMDELSDNMQGFQVIYMPKTNETGKSEGGSKRENARFNISFCEGCFNIMNFVRNLFDGENFFTKLHETLMEAYKQYLNDIVKDQEGEKYDSRKTRAFLNENSLRNNYKNWVEKTYGLAMPLYSFDMMYNIFKRQYKNQKRLPASIKTDNAWNYVRTVYDDIGKLLKCEDEFYYSDADGEIKEEEYRFYRAYAESPFMTYVNNMTEEEEELFKKRFGDLALILANSSTSGGISKDDLSVIRDR